MRDVLAGIGTTGDYENVEKIVIGADFTVESKIEINKSIVVDGNNHTITAIGNAAWTGTSGDDKYAVTVNNADAEVCNIVIDNGGVAYGFNVFGTADNTVKLKNITSNNSAGAGFCFNGAVVEATSLSATGYKWGGANADKGADVSLDTINGIGSIYTENSTSDAVEITFPEKYVAPVELGVGTSGTQGYYNGFYTNLNEAAAAYAAVSITAQDATKTIDVNSSVSLTTAITLDTKTTFNIASDAILSLYANIGGTGSVNNDGIIKVLAQDVSVTAKLGGSGSMDTSAVMKDATLSGDLETSTEFGPNQTVTVTGNLNLLKNTVLTIEGKLIVPEGVTVTIEDGAKLVISGQSAAVENSGSIMIQAVGGLEIDGGVVTNNGTIDAQYLPAEVQNDDADVITIAQNAKLINNGTVTIGTDSAISITGSFTNSKDAVTNINGTLEGKISNAGTVNISGNTKNTAVIGLTASDAVVNVNAITGTVVVNNADFESPTNTPFANDTKDSSVTISSTAGSIGGIVVKAITYTSEDAGKTVANKALDIAGTVSVTATDGTADKDTSIVRFSGEDIRVTDTFSIGAGSTFALGPYNGSSATAITVDGSMNITSKVGDSFAIQKSKGAVNVYVNGEIASLENLTNTAYGITMNAAGYTVVANAITTYYYTTLSAAIEAMTDATIKTVDVYGKVKAEGEITIVSGMTVRMNNNAELDIVKDASVTVVDGGKITMTSTNSIEVAGSLYFAVARTGVTGAGENSIISEVKSSNGTDALYTNLVAAMADAESGDTIELNNKDVVLTNTSFTIKEGVTVDTKGKAFTVQGTSLTIDGTLFINDSVYTVEGYKISESYTQPSNVVLNGYIKNTVSMDPNTESKYPAGAYYQVAENGIPYYYATTVSNSASVINDAEGDKVIVYGKVSMGTVAFTGTTDYPAHVVIDSKAEITSGNITLNTADLYITSGAKFTANIANANGNVDVKMVYTTGTAGDAMFSAAMDSDNVDVLTVSGQATGAVMTFNGNVSISSLNISEMTVEGTVTVEGSNPSLVVSETLTVSGTLSINAGSLTVTNAVAFVSGTLETAVASAESSATGSAQIGTLYVGIGKDKDGKLSDTAAGTVAGNVTADIAYVGADSVVSEKITAADAVESIEFYVEDNLWMTVYGAADETAHVPNAPVINADFKGWMAEGETQATKYVYNETTKDIEIELSAEDKLYADVDYDIYTVNVRTDGGIGSVAIDGKIMSNPAGGNTFSIGGLKAGEHKLSYTLKNGFTGEATMSIDGQAISGDVFTISGESLTITIDLAGTEPVSGSGQIVVNTGSDDMSLTDILLIVLVVLIVIMAVIVALRLMRS